MMVVSCPGLSLICLLNFAEEEEKPNALVKLRCTSMGRRCLAVVEGANGGQLREVGAVVELGDLGRNCVVGELLPSFLVIPGDVPHPLQPLHVNVHHASLPVHSCKRLTCSFAKNMRTQTLTDGVSASVAPRRQATGYGCHPKPNPMGHNI